MKVKFTAWIFLLLLFSCGDSDRGEPTVDGTPNILFIYTDDQTFSTIHALGNEVIKTPNLDRLVNEGTTFTHAYNMGGWHGAVCVASRSMMISGAMVWRAKEKEERWQAKDSVAMSETWGQLMRDRGYNTYMSGKWHVKVPAEHVFDRARHVRPGMPADAWGRGGGGKKVSEAIKSGGDVAASMPVGYNRPNSRQDSSWSPSDPKFGGFWEGGKHWSEVLRDDAVDFIADASKKDDPFFMYLAFNAPHDPRQAPQEFVDMYDVDEMPIPSNFLPEYPWKDSINNGPGLRDEALAPYPRTKYAVQKHIQEYYAIISHLDHQVGEILEALEASGKMENTYIFFTSDHGLAVGHHGLIGKQNLFDHSVRVPLMVVGPDVPRGQKLEQDVYLQDVMASSLQLAGIKKPDYVEFHSFMDLVNEPERDGHYDAIYGCYMNVQRMIRKDGLKLLVYPRGEKVFLFDLEKDPDEMNDLAQVPAYKDQVALLFDTLIAMQKSMGDDLDLSGIRSRL